MKLLLLGLVLAALAGVQDATVYEPGNGVSLPSVVRQVKADYTEEAKQNRIEGRVGLQAIVLADGAVGDVKVVESLDTVYGLDKNAVASMKQWAFKPGMKDGKAVNVRIHVQIDFSLR